MYPYFRLKEEGFQVDMAALTKKSIQTVVHTREPGFDTAVEHRGYLWPADLAFEDVNPEEYDGLVIPGGRFPEYIRMRPALERIVRHFFDAKKPVAAICHGPLILSAYGLIDGKRCTAVRSIRPDMEAVGATYEDKEVVVDGRLVTSRTWRDLWAFMREFIRLLKE